MNARNRPGRPEGGWVAQSSGGQPRGKGVVSPLDSDGRRVDNSDVTTWSRIARYAGIGLGGAGLLAGLAYKVAAQPVTLGNLGWLSLGVAPLYAVAVWLIRKRPDHPQARRILLLGTVLGIGVGIEGPIQDAFRDHGPGQWFWWVNVISQYIGLLSMIAWALLIASFPDGTVERRWQRVVLKLVWLHLLLPPLLLLTNPNVVIDMYALDPAPAPVVPSPLYVPWLAALGPPLATVFQGYYGGFVVAPILFVRFLQAGRDQRARMRLMVYLAAALLLVFPVQFALAARYGADEPLWLRLFGGLIILLMAMMPVSVVIGIIRHHLFDLDIVVRRSVVYGALSLVIAAAYVALAAAPGLTFGSSIPVELAVLVTIIAAVAFQPVRRWLEKLADRLVFGERVNRYLLLTRFGAQLEQTVELDELLPRLAGTVHRGLASRWVRVTLPGASAVNGDPVGEAALTVPLGRRGEVVGQIECGPKDGGYEPSDRELLATLAGQAATAIANVQLTARLADQVEELARSRARIVAAQDAERRRIERNIHDGAQQQVVALIMKLRLARNQIGRGDRPSDEVLDELQADARELLADLRELAHGIHPPVLGDRGLVAAVEARVDRLPLRVVVHAAPALRDHRLATDVEGAAYFVICEALSNVVKHSAASAADIDMSTVDGHLVVLVHDNGIGLAAQPSGGHGLTNLRDRVEALGGELRVNGEPGEGTSVRAELPIGASHD